MTAGARTPEPTLTRRLARSIRERPSSATDLAAAERYVRDWLGSTVAGRKTEPGRALLAYGGGSEDLEARVFLHAALSHITETDDLHRGSVTHPGCAVIPAALVLGRARGLGGTAILRGVLAGYEAMLRVGEALGPGHYRLFHNTATAGVFGSAAAAASVLDLDEDRWVWAMGSAGTQAAGLWQFNADATMSKHLHAGHAASAGLRGALLAERGFTGPAAVLEGERGFFRALCPDPDPEAVLRENVGWKLPETSLKPYPCCRHIHPAIDAALGVRDRLDGAAVGNGAVRAIRVDTYGAARAVTDNPAPTVPYAAKFSMQFCVGSALLHGVPGLASFDPIRLEDPQVRALMDRTALEVSEALDAAYPERWGAGVSVELESGDVVEERRSDARGDPESPMRDDEIDEKVRGLCRFGGLDAAATSTLLDACRALVEGGPAPRLLSA